MIRFCLLLCFSWFFASAISRADEVDFSAALGTPDRVWNASENYGTRATIVADESAEGGAFVKIPARNSLTTVMAEEYFVKVRFRKSNVMAKLNGEILPPQSWAIAPGDEGTGWQTNTFAMTEPGNFEIATYGSDNDVDSVRFVPRPGSIAEAVGMPEGEIAVGGASSWVISPSQETEEYGVKVNLTESSREAWMDFSASGPARLKVKFRQQSSGTLQIISGGKVRWDSWEDDYYGNEVELEIPEGIHPIRLRAALSENVGAQTRIVGIDNIEVIPLTEGGRVLAAMDDTEPWAMNSEWVPGAVARNGGDSIRPEAVGYVNNLKLRRSFTGPGTVSFWSHVGEVPDGGVTLEWSTDFSDGEERSSHDDELGWRKTSVWLPPGEHWVRWEASGNGEHFSQIALDEIQFEPSPVAAIGEALGMPQLVWRNDPAAPWSALERAGEGVAVSAPTSGDDLPVSTTIAATLPGPGSLSFRWKNGGYRQMQGEFWIDGKKHSELWSFDSESMEIVIPHEKPVEVKWVGNGQSRWTSWLELDQLSFVATEEIPLEDALDTPSGVTWTSSAESPVRGRKSIGAKNGSAAHVSLAPGEETWLEATVDGAGIFDFWLRDVPGAANDPREVQWELFIDGVKSHINSEDPTWPAQWVFGEGSHKIRLKFRSSADAESTVFIGVDDVSWIPLAPGEVDAGWTASHPELARGFSSGGQDGGPQHVLPVGTGEIRWIEKSVTGPGVLMWSESFSHGRYPAARLKVLLDGVCELPEQGKSSWGINRLSVPAGVHTVRWLSEPEFYEGEPYEVLADSVWQISGISFTPGVPQLMTAIEDTGNVWLAVGHEDGDMVVGTEAHDGVDAWSMGDETVLYLCNPGHHGLMTRGMVYRFDFDGGDFRWLEFPRWVGPGDVVEWVSARSYGFANYVPPCIVDAFSAESMTIVPLKEALDLEEEISSENWIGLQNGVGAFDGVDSGWSLVTNRYQKNQASMTVPGPAKIRFRWKATGNGKLGVLVDGAWLPVNSPGGNWSEVEFDLSETSEVKWVHAAVQETLDDAPGEAWLDGVSVTPVPTLPLHEAAGADSGLHFNSVEQHAGGTPWKSLAYRDGDGIWREAARGIASAGELRTSVTGPAIVSFRAYCTNVTIPDPAVLSKSVIIIINPSPGMQIEGRYFGVKVGDREVLRLTKEETSGWQEHRFHVPAGEHVVSWKIGDIVDYGYPPENPVPEGQAWVTGISVKHPRADYDEWASTSLAGNIKSDPKDDADGDGQINYLEYAYGTDPDDASSRSPEMFGMGWGNNVYRLYIPRLPAHVPAVLMTSGDLVNWVASPRQLRSSRFLSSGWLEPVLRDFDSGIHQVIEFDSSSGGKSKFFRMELSPP